MGGEMGRKRLRDAGLDEGGEDADGEMKVLVGEEGCVSWGERGKGRAVGGEGGQGEGEAVEGARPGLQTVQKCREREGCSGLEVMISTRFVQQGWQMGW